MQKKSGILGYLYTKTSLTIRFASGDAYRYDLSEVLTKEKLKKMITLARSGKGLNGFLNQNTEICKYGYLDTTLSKGSFKPYSCKNVQV